MSYTYRDTIPDHSISENIPNDALIQIFVWEAHTVKRSETCARFLAVHSFDFGPIIIDKIPLDRSCYRFTRMEWFSEVKPFLIHNRIPVTIQILRTGLLAETKQLANTHSKL
jgi:hypothetical protein